MSLGFPLTPNSLLAFLPISSTFLFLLKLHSFLSIFCLVFFIFCFSSFSIGQPKQLSASFLFETSPNASSIPFSSSQLSNPFLLAAPFPFIREMAWERAGHVMEVPYPHGSATSAWEQQSRRGLSAGQGRRGTWRAGVVLI